MDLSALGQAARDCWNEIPAHFPFVVLDAFVIMPNHVHGIIVIDKPDDQPDADAAPAAYGLSPNANKNAADVSG